MHTLTIDRNNALSFVHETPEGEGATFVFFNPLSGDFSSWQSQIVPALRSKGHGALLWNYRGQKGSPIGIDVEISASLIEDDSRKLILDQRPARPIYVGLSIGGLFAIDLHLGGVPAKGLVLINTLREDGPRLRWINDAVTRAALVGGSRLLRDLFAPLLFAEKWQAENRHAFLTDDAYAPCDANSPDLRLLKAGTTGNWNIDYEKIDVPVSILTGAQDRVFRDPDAIERLSARISDHTVAEIEDAGHMLPAERPDIVIDACLALAARV